MFPLIVKGQATTDVLPTVEQCDSMNKQYFKYPSQYKTEAEYDYQKLQKAFGDKEWDLTDQSKKTIIRSLRGSLVCYCYAITKYVDLPDLQVKRLKQYENDDFAKNGCRQIDDFRTDSVFLGLEITLIIITLNAILEEVIDYFICRLGYDSHTEEANKVKKYVFANTYFNTAVVILLMGANLDLPIVGHVFQGLYRDFTDQWFVVIGSQIVLNALGDIVSPIISYFLGWLFMQFDHCIDQKRCCGKKRYPQNDSTSCRTMGEYWKYYAGPEYHIESE